jgi:hypothetical protein
MPAHLIQAMPMLVLGLAALAGIAVAWLRGRRAGGQRAAAAGRDLAIGVALAGSWAAIWALYATYTWTAAAGLSTLQAARFYLPALGSISLLGAWLLVRVPRSQRLAAITTLVVAGILFGLGGWAFHDMYQSPFGRQLQVVHGPGGTVELKPGPGVRIGGVGPGSPGRAGPIGPSAEPRLSPPPWQKLDKDRDQPASTSMPVRAPRTPRQSGPAPSSARTVRTKPHVRGQGTSPSERCAPRVTPRSGCRCGGCRASPNQAPIPGRNRMITRQESLVRAAGLGAT